METVVGVDFINNSTNSNLKSRHYLDGKDILIPIQHINDNSESIDVITFSVASTARLNCW